MFFVTIEIQKSSHLAPYQPTSAPGTHTRSPVMDLRDMINGGSMLPLTPKQVRRVQRTVIKLENAQAHLQAVRQHEASPSGRLQASAFEGGLFGNNTGERAYAERQVRHYEQKLASLQRSSGP